MRKVKYLSVLAAVILCLWSIAIAGDIPVGGAPETIEVTSSTAVGLTSSKIDAVASSPSAGCHISIEDAVISWAFGTPTASVGHLEYAGTSFDLDSVSMMRQFKAIAVSTTAHIKVSYYK